MPTRRAAAHGRDGHAQARSGTPGGKSVVHAAQERHELLLGLRGYRFAANSVMPETNEGSSIAARSYNKVARSLIFISDLQSPISTCGGGVSGGESTSFQGDAPFLSHLQADLHPLSRQIAISSRPHDSLGAFGAKSTSPSPARDLEVPMSAAQDLYLQLKISEFCERCCVWKISDRHLRSPLNKSTGVPQRSRCMPEKDPPLPQSP